MDVRGEKTGGAPSSRGHVAVGPVPGPWTKPDDAVDPEEGS